MKKPNIMKNVKSFDLFVNEKINWDKQPWKILKNIMNLEEPDIKEEEVQDIKKPDDIVEMIITFQLSILRPDTPSRVEDAIEILIKKYHLTGDINHKGWMEFELKLKGKRKDVDAFYNQLQKLIQD